MKKLIYLLLISFLISCSGTDEKTSPENILEDLTYSVDTLIIDSGEEIFNLRYGLSNFGVFPQSNSLVLFDQSRKISQWIDLENQKLVDQYQFQKDGPNGLGNIFSMQTLPEEKLMMASFTNTGVFDKEGNQLEQFKLKPNELDGLSELNPFDILTKLKYDPSSNLLFSLPGDMSLGTRKLAKIDPVNQTGKIIPLTKMDNAGNFRVTLLDEGGSIFEETYDQLIVGNQLFITCSYSSGIYQYDIEKDSLNYLEFTHQLIPNEKTGEIVNNPGTSEDWWQEYKKVVSQISYWGLHWDEKTARYYRLASKSLLGESRNDPASYEVYLLVYSEDMKLLGEALIPDFQAFPQSYFFNDGKLYSYVNVEDELGFAVFTFDS